MSIPTNHKHILPFMFPNAEAESWLVYEHDGVLAFRYFDEVAAGGAEPTAQDIIDAGNSQAFTQSQEPAHVEINGIKMATDLQSQAAFSNMMILLNEAGMADTEMVMIKDCFGASHAMTLADFRTQAVAYGLSCYQAFHS